MIGPDADLLYAEREIAEIKELLSAKDAEIERLREAQKWTATKDQWPPEETPVLVISEPWPEQISTALIVWEDAGEHGAGYLWYVHDGLGGINDSSNYECDDEYQFSHWMPIPKPPTLEEKR